MSKKNARMAGTNGWSPRGHEEWRIFTHLHNLFLHQFSLFTGTYGTKGCSRNWWWVKGVFIACKSTRLTRTASGLLGRDVIAAFKRAQWKTTGTGLSRAAPPAILKLDLLQKDNVVSILEESRYVRLRSACLASNLSSPNVVIHCMITIQHNSSTILTRNYRCC